jgi:hypothetical protein
VLVRYLDLVKHLLASRGLELYGSAGDAVTRLLRPLALEA